MNKSTAKFSSKTWGKMYVSQLQYSNYLMTCSTSLKGLKGLPHQEIDFYQNVNWVSGIAWPKEKL